MPRPPLAIGACSLLLPALLAHAISARAEQHSVSFDLFTLHEGSHSVTIHAGGGDVIEVTLLHVRPDWVVRQTGVLKSATTQKAPPPSTSGTGQKRAESPESRVLKDAGLTRDQDVTGQKRVIDIPHLPQFGGYILTVVPTYANDGPFEVYVRHPGVTDDQYAKVIARIDSVLKEPGGPQGDELKAWTRDQLKGTLDIDVEGPATLLVVVEDEDHWALELAGGFSATGLRDPFYAGKATTDAGGNPVTTVTRLREKEGSFDTGVAAMMHVYYTRHPGLAASFGFATGSESALTLLPGASLRLGGVMWLTLGAALGHEKVLPGDLREGDVMKDPNALTNLPSRAVCQWFAGVSFAFLNPGESAFKKPFQPLGQDTTKTPATQ